jgi:hypothetical protein
VFKAAMPLRHTLTAVAGAALAALVLAAPAPAKIIEIGSVPEEASPTCPSSPCLAVSRTTGYQTSVAGNPDAFVAPRNGKIVAWTIALGDPDRRQTRFFDGNYGESVAQLTVLRRGKRLFSRVVGKSPLQTLQPYFGQTVQFPLDRAINVKRGSMIALTVPTWAPALTQLLDDGSSWRASRPERRCEDTEIQTAQTDMRDLTRYLCRYRARLTYSATLITQPKTNAERQKRTKRSTKRP